MDSSIPIILTSILLILMVVILISNGMVLFLFVKDPALRVPTNIFIGMLCIADVLVGLNIPLVVASTVHPEMASLRAWCAYKFSIIKLFVSISFALQVAVAVDRIIAIVKPLHYSKIVTVKCALWTSLLIFLYCFGMFFLLPILWRRNADQCFLWKIMNLEYILYIAMPHYMILAGALIYCYSHIFTIAKKVKQRGALNMIILPNAGTGRTFESEMKAVKILLLVVGLIFLTWIPYHLIFLVIHFYGENDALRYIGHIATHLPYLNSAWNPWIYANRLPAFRTSMRNVFQLTRLGQLRPQTSQVVCETTFTQPIPAIMTVQPDTNT